MNVVLWIVQVVLAAMFLYAGITKAFQYEKAKEKMAWVKDVSKGLVICIGVAELLGGLALLLPGLFGFWQALVPLAALGLAIIMLLAAGFHVKRKENQAIITNVVLLVLAAFVAYGRWFVVPH